MVQLSIVIPIYNVEKYIGACFESIYGEKIADNLFEVIAVNDGTPDRSMEIVHRYALKHHNLRIINKLNGGVSSARNMGIAAARGRYVTFVDPDDYIESDALRKISAFLPESMDDMVILKWRYPETGEVTIWPKQVVLGRKYVGEDLYDIFFKGSSWGCLYSRRFLNDNFLIFPDGIVIAEDSIFFSLCMLYAHSVVFKDIIMYNYLMHQGSASNSCSEKHIDGYVSGLNYLVIYSNEHVLNKRQMAIISHTKYRLIVGLINMALKLGYPFKRLKQEVVPYLPILNVRQIRNRGKIWIYLLNVSYTVFWLKMKYGLCCRR